MDEKLRNIELGLSVVEEDSKNISTELAVLKGDSSGVKDINYKGYFESPSELPKIQDVHYFQSEEWITSILYNELPVIGNLDQRLWYANVGGKFAYVKYIDESYQWVVSDAYFENKATTGMKVTIYRDLSTGENFEDIIKQTYLTNSVFTRTLLSAISQSYPDLLIVPNAGYSDYKKGLSKTEYISKLNDLFNNLPTGSPYTSIVVYSAPNIDTGYIEWVDEIEKKCQELSIHFVNLNSSSGINPRNKEVYLLDENTLNEIGAKRIAKLTSQEADKIDKNSYFNRELIPAIYIETADGLDFEGMTKDEAKKNLKKLIVDPRGSGLPFINGDLNPQKDEIRGRGNSTWGFPKKPYRFKFNKKVSLLGIPAEKNFVLLANYADKTGIRPALAHRLGNHIQDFRNRKGEPTWYVPSSIQVEVYMNGRYDGLYTLTDHVSKPASSRVNIIEPEPGDIAVLNSSLGHYELNNDIYPNVSGGFIFELEATYRVNDATTAKPVVDHNNIVTGSKGDDVFIKCMYGSEERYFAVKTLDVYKKDLVTASSPFGIVLQSYMNYASDYLSGINTVIMSSISDIGGKSYMNRIMEVIDLDTFIDWFFINEIYKNNDAQGFSSIYYHKERDTEAEVAKLRMGPLWDFDLAAGNYKGKTGENPVGWYVRENTWIKALLRDTTVKHRFINRWLDLGFDKIVHRIIDRLAAESYQASISNGERWKIDGNYFDEQIVTSPIGTNSYDSQIVWLRRWINKRLVWINENINNI